MSDLDMKVRELISENIDLTTDIDNIEPESDLTEYGMDSLNAIKLIVAIEVEYSYEFPVEDLLIESVNSVNKVTVYITNNCL
jgi:acyl carrier protein